MVNLRGWLVVFLFAAVSLGLGFYAGCFKTTRDWQTYARADYLGMLCKADRLR